MIARGSKFSTLSQPRRINFLRAAIIGFGAGLVAVSFTLLMKTASHWRDILLDSIASSSLPGWFLFGLISATLGALAAWMTLRYCPEATGSGIPHVKATLLHLRVIHWYKLIPVKILAGLMACFGGFSLGREGPTVQLGAAAASAIADWFRIPLRTRTHLIACGAGAGLAAAFNAPLAGFIFVIEELRRELSPLTYGTALIAAVTADAVTRVVIGPAPALSVGQFEAIPLSAFGAVITIGILAGVIGVAFNRGLTASLSLLPYLRSFLPRWVRAAVLGFLIGVIGWFVPMTLGSGDRIIEYLLHVDGRVVVGSLFVLLVLKLLLTIASYLAGIPGGIFAPLLSQGALIGVLVGSFFGPEVGVYGVVGMAAYFSGIVRAPLTAVILIIEMTGKYELLFPLLAACLVSYVVAELFGEKPLYEAMLELNLQQRGLRESSREEPVVVDFVIEPGSQLDGKRIRELNLPKGCLLIGIRNSLGERIPNGATLLRAGEEVKFVVDVKSLSNLRSRTSAPWKEASSA